MDIRKDFSEQLHCCIHRSVEFIDPTSSQNETKMVETYVG